MSLWKELLAPQDTVTAPWIGGRLVRARGRQFKIAGARPDEYGWHEFDISGGRKASWVGPGEPDYDQLDACPTVTGYLVGNRLLPDDLPISANAADIIRSSIAVHLVEAGLERFCRATVAVYEGAHIFLRQEFPLGPEHEVLEAFQDRRPNLTHVAGVVPALDASFRWQTWWRLHEAEVRAARQREREERAARLEAERIAAERRDQIRRHGGDGAARRELAQIDFGAAAQAALGVSGAELLDHRPSHNAGQEVVQFRHEHRRFECVVDRATLGVIDAGICLVDHHTGERGDDRFTLESLPAVITEAIRDGVLVVFRHAR